MTARAQTNLYLTAGGYPWFSAGYDVDGSFQGAMNLSAERAVKEKRYVKGTIGTGGKENENFAIGVAYNWLLSGDKKPNEILELNGGLLTYFRNGTVRALPLVNVGYRYQNLEKPGLILRYGIGTEILGFYISLGYSF